MIREVFGRCELILADCYEVLPSLGRFDCFVSDPPYLFNTSGGGRFRKDRPNMDDIKDAGLDTGFDTSIINPLLYPSAVVFCHNNQLHEVLPYLAGVYSRYAMCFWEKTNPLPVANKHYQANIEPYIHAWSAGHHPVGELADKKRTILTKNGKSKYGHPTVKPDEVMMKIMRNVNGDSVVDPFMGTGSTIVAAMKMGKRAVGIERRRDYFDIACKRIEETMNNQLDK